jgi:hypothetical protein
MAAIIILNAPSRHKSPRGCRPTIASDVTIPPPQPPIGFSLSELRRWIVLGSGDASRANGSVGTVARVELRRKYNRANFSRLKPQPFLLVIDKTVCINFPAQYRSFRRRDRLFTQP